LPRSIGIIGVAQLKVVVTAAEGVPKGASQATLEVKMAVCQNLVPLVNIKIAGKWMFIPLKMVLIGIDPYPNR